MHALAVVLVETEVERGERRDRRGDADRVLRVERRAGGARGRFERRYVLAVALGEADGAQRQARAEVAEDELGRAPPMSTSSVRGVELADAAPRQLRLFVAREQPRREAVAPLDLAEERLAVLRVADGARRDEERPLGTERLGRAAVVGEGVADARDRDGEEAAARVDPFAESRDPRLAVQLLDAAVLDVARRGGASCSCPGRSPRRSRRGGIGDSPDGAIRLVERRAEHGELCERDAQPLDALLQLGRISGDCDPVSRRHLRLRRELVEPANGLPTSLVRLTPRREGAPQMQTVARRSPRWRRGSAQPRWPNPTSGRVVTRVLQCGPRRGVEQSGSSPGS